MEAIIMQEHEELKRLIEEAENDIKKAEGGNKAAGTRVRKQMQQIKQAAQALRNKVLELRSTTEE
jgi:predicted  nucleic acid-binding Zn-ribbon protein